MLMERLFTADKTSPYDQSRFEAHTDADTEPVGAPRDWSAEAIQVFVSALARSIPTQRLPIEENTLPSWLWQRRSAGAAVTNENSAQQVFDRVAGSATYTGWKKGLFADEAEASIFYDEIRALLAERVIALEPRRLARLGINWAYGVAPQAMAAPAAPVPSPDFETVGAADSVGAVAVRNATLDRVLSNGNATLQSQWQKLMRADNGRGALELDFTDTKAEWGASPASTAPRLMIDLLRLRRDDGSLDVPALQQAVRLSVILLELHYDQLADAADASRALAIGYGNLAALLMSMALPFDGDAARATAAGISAIITAEAVATSAQLAALLGPCHAFIDEREIRMRSLRNQRRSAYGERNDYERLSILPVPLEIAAGVDLVVIAEARRLWDRAVELAQQNGLCHLHLTTLFSSAEFAAFLDCSAQGIGPEAHLVRPRSVAPDLYHRAIHPAVPLALAKTGCDPFDIKGIVDYALGTGTLVAAPGVNHSVLRERGFDAAALSRVEDYLPRVNDIRHAFTPWILGQEFCREHLGITDEQMDDFGFDLLHHMGFSEADIAAANAYSCGHGTVVGASELPPAVEKIFALAGTSAQVRMAAAVQSFITGDAGLIVALGGENMPERRSEVLLLAWRLGVRSLTFCSDGFVAPERMAPPAVHILPRKKLLKRSAPRPPATPASLALKPTTAQMTAPRTATKLKVAPRAVGLKHPATEVVGQREKRR